MLIAGCDKTHGERHTALHHCTGTAGIAGAATPSADAAAGAAGATAATVVAPGCTCPIGTYLLSTYTHRTSRWRAGATSMILIENEKYACVQCIRGHRSTTCQHLDRPLVQVRSRGRPVSGPAHRVAVIADTSATPCGCSANEALILKATHKQVVTVEGGRLEVVDRAHTPSTDGSRPAFKVLLLKTLAGGCCRKPQLGRPGLFKLASSNAELFDSVVAKACTIPGTCACDDNCGCADCVVHKTGAPLSRDETPEVLDPQVLLFESVCMCAPGACSCFDCEEHGRRGGASIKEPFELPPLPPLPPELAAWEELQELDHDCMCPADACHCYNCFKHGVIQGQRNELWVP